MTDLDRLKDVYHIIKTRKLIRNQDSLAERIGYNKSSISEIMNGKVPLSDKFIRVFCSEFNINYDYIINGTGDVFLTPSQYVPEINSRIKHSFEIPEGNRRLIPYYDIDFMAGTADIFNDVQEAPSYYLDINPYNDCEYALPIFGDSMYPIYQAGDIALCKLINDRSIIPLGEAYLIVTSEHRMLKYLKRGNVIGTLLAVSENAEQYEPFSIEVDKILKLYKVKGVIKRKSI